MRALGRPFEHLKNLPAALVIVGRTRAVASEQKSLLDNLVHRGSGVPNLSRRRRIELLIGQATARYPAIQCTSQQA
jgi:hypothetical protein